VKRKRDQFQVVPMDGWIRLAPGAWVSFHVDTPLSPNWPQLTGWMRQIRGAVLSDAFGLENDLILLELAAEYGTADHGTASDEFFEKDQMLREEHSLDRKIGRAKPIIRRMRDALLADRLIQQLVECREIRNLMAHYACWIEPINDEAKQMTIALKLLIGDRSHVWELEGTDVANWERLFLDARRELIRLRHELTGEPAPEFVEGSIATITPQQSVATGA
jgi:hypothetical protein